MSLAGGMTIKMNVRQPFTHLPDTLKPITLIWPGAARYPFAPPEAQRPSLFHRKLEGKNIQNVPVPDDIYVIDNR